MSLYEDCFIEAGMGAVPGVDILAGLCLRAGGRCSCPADLQDQLDSMKAQIEELGRGGSLSPPPPAPIPAHIVPPPPPRPPPPPAAPEFQACTCATCADFPPGADLCIPWDAARPCDCLASAESQGNAQPFPASTQVPRCCREEWPAEASCQQQSTGSEEFYDQQEIVVRIHGRVTFSWYVFTPP